jgi:hypothetical protein
MVDNVLPALAIFAVAASITRGPNNIIVMASGANFGLVRPVPHLCGISTGVFTIISLIGLGLMAVFDAFPILHTFLRIVSASSFMASLEDRYSRAARGKSKGSCTAYLFPICSLSSGQSKDMGHRIFSGHAVCY